MPVSERSYLETEHSGKLSKPETSQP